MEIFLKIQKYIFTITLIAASFLGFSLAYLTSVVMKHGLNPAVSAKPRRGKSPRTSAVQRQRIAFGAFEEICSGPFIRDTASCKGIPKGGDGKENGGTPTTNIELVGLLAGSPRFARASVKVKGEKEAHEYGVGATVAGHKILSIRSNSIMVAAGGRQFPIYLGEASDKAGSRSTPTATSSSNKNAKKTTLSRTKLKALMKKDTMAQVRAALFKKGGRTWGVRIHYVPPNHVVYKLGARPGDIIRRYNGDRLDSMSKLVSLYSSLQSPSFKRATLDIERAGKCCLTYEFIVTD